jgi:hypothetical protein
MPVLLLGVYRGVVASLTASVTEAGANAPARPRPASGWLETHNASPETAAASGAEFDVGRT